MKATLINNVTGERIPVTSNTEHHTCSYGQPVWVDESGTAYLQVGLESMQPLYRIEDIDDIEEYNKHLPVIL